MRRRTDVTGVERSPGTPPSESGRMRQGVGVIRPVDVAIQKYAKRFGRLLGLSTAAPFDGYVADLVAALPVSMLNPEDLYPEDIISEGGALIGAGGAGNRSILQISSPPPGFLLCVESLSIQRVTTAGEVDVFWGVQLLPVFGFQPGIQADIRGGITPAIQFATKNNAAALALPGNFVMAFSGAGVNPAQLGPFVLVPASQAAQAINLTIQGTTDNEALQATARGHFIKLPGT